MAMLKSASLSKYENEKKIFFNVFIDKISVSSARSETLQGPYKTLRCVIVLGSFMLQSKVGSQLKKSGVGGHFIRKGL
jgi:hypothetical protein